MAYNIWHFADLLYYVYEHVALIYIVRLLVIAEYMVSVCVRCMVYSYKAIKVDCTPFKCV